MTIGLIVVGVIALAVIAFVTAPLLRSHTEEVIVGATIMSRARELHSQRDMLLASIRELEDDRATDKLSAEDFDELNARLSTEAIAVLDELEELEKTREALSADDGAVRALEPRPTSRRR
jgi:hypothetical protein